MKNFYIYYMEVEERKNQMRQALIISFVDEYEAYKKSINLINSDFKKSNIDFEYKYDDFCKDFLNHTLKNLDNIDIFSFNDFNQFYINFWKFNLYTLQCMLTDKLNELGYKYDDFYHNSDIKKKIESNENQTS